jgi:hypothetical protein
MNTRLLSVLLILQCAIVADRVEARQSDTTGSKIQIVDAKLGTSVENRNVIGEADTFPASSKVFFWLKAAGSTSDSITVTWKHGETSYNTKLFLGGSPWRTWASKTVGSAGEWTVSVSDDMGNVLKEMTFKVE